MTPPGAPPRHASSGRRIRHCAHAPTERPSQYPCACLILKWGVRFLVTTGPAHSAASSLVALLLPGDSRLSHCKPRVFLCFSLLEPLVSSCHHPGGEWWANILRVQYAPSRPAKSASGVAPSRSTVGTPCFRSAVCSCATDVLPEPEARRVSVTQLRTRTIDAWLYLLTSRTKDTALTANAWLQTDAGKEGDALQARTVLPLAPRSPVRKPSRRGTSLLRITELFVMARNSSFPFKGRSPRRMPKGTSSDLHRGILQRRVSVVASREVRPRQLHDAHGDKDLMKSIIFACGVLCPYGFCPIPGLRTKESVRSRNHAGG